MIPTRSRCEARDVLTKGMSYTIVAVQAGLIPRDGYLQPGYVYLVSTGPAIRTADLGLYFVIEQPGVHPFPVRDGRWCASLSSFHRRDSIDPSHFEGDIRDYLTALDRSYIVYYFSDFSMEGLTKLLHDKGLGKHVEPKCVQVWWRGDALSIR